MHEDLVYPHKYKVLLCDVHKRSIRVGLFPGSIYNKEKTEVYVHSIMCSMSMIDTALPALWFPFLIILKELRNETTSDYKNQGISIVSNIKFTWGRAKERC